MGRAIAVGNEANLISAGVQSQLPPAVGRVRRVSAELDYPRPGLWPGSSQCGTGPTRLIPEAHRPIAAVDVGVAIGFHIPIAEPAKGSAALAGHVPIPTGRALDGGGGRQLPIIPGENRRVEAPMAEPDPLHVRWVHGIRAVLIQLLQVGTTIIVHIMIDCQ